MKDDDQIPLILTYMRGKRNKEKIAEKHIEISIPLIRGIPMEMEASSPHKGGHLNLSLPGILQNPE